AHPSVQARHGEHGTVTGPCEVRAPWGRSAFHCPYCHGHECTGKHVTVSVRGLGLSLGVAIFGSLLTRQLQGRAPSPEATAAAIPGVLSWGAPATAVLVALMILLPSPRS
ncbi:hypothetical protein ACWDX9_62040, partial [Nonomuraea sp. NPDC003201]